MTDTVAIILAAGISSRMKSDTPKVLYEVCGRPMLEYVLNACREAGVKTIYVVVGFGAETVKERFSGAEDIVWVRQKEQKGTAHAVLCCKEYLDGFDGQTLILCGDGPLIRVDTLREIIEKHGHLQPAATLATAVLDDPNDYGRICRDDEGNIESIVEHNECTDQQRDIKEVNPSYYLFNNKLLFDVLEHVKPDNTKKEYYLTDAIRIMIEAGHKVKAIAALSPEEAMSANTKGQLAKIEEIMRQRMKEDTRA